MDGRIVMVTPRDPGHAWKKVDNVLKIVDAELGFVGVGVRNKTQSKVGTPPTVDWDLSGCFPGPGPGAVCIGCLLQTIWDRL